VLVLGPVSAAEQAPIELRPTQRTAGQPRRAAERRARSIVLHLFSIKLMLERENAPGGADGLL
jgi:hypothetical protein